jgi:hypothetical protein
MRKINSMFLLASLKTLTNPYNCPESHTKKFLAGFWNNFQDHRRKSSLKRVTGRIFTISEWTIDYMTIGYSVSVVVG